MIICNIPEGTPSEKIVTKNTQEVLPSINKQIAAFVHPVGFIFYVTKSNELKRMPIHLSARETWTSMLMEEINYSFDEDIKLDMCMQYIDNTTGNFQ